MCGIFGFIKTGNYDADETKKDINKLFKLTEPRGRQSSGLTIYTQKNISVFKAPQTASKLIKSKYYKDFLDQNLHKEGEYTAVLGHCRLVTDGSELNSQHNQPIMTDKVVGVHNGVLNNYE